MPQPIFSRSASEYSLDGSPVESPDSSYLDGPFDSLSLASTPDTEHSDAFDHVRILAPGQNTNEFILVVGGLGYIGSHTSWELLKDGYNVVVIDDLSNSFTTVLDTLRAMNSERHQESKSRRPELHFHQADFRDQGTMEEIL